MPHETDHGDRRQNRERPFGRVWTPPAGDRPGNPPFRARVGIETAPRPACGAPAGLREAIGGIDLAVLDGTYLYRGASANPHISQDGAKDKSRTNALVIGKDAVAVEAVGAVLAGMEPEKMTVWVAPILAQASMATGNSGIMGR